MNYGLDFSAIREIKFLREIKHDNIVQVTTLHTLINALQIFLVLDDLDVSDDFFNAF